jgi:hypothetical protein
VFTHYGALEELKTNKPRVSYIFNGETDEWALLWFLPFVFYCVHQVDADFSGNLDFVESDPSQKENGISIHHRSRTWRDIKSRMDKSWSAYKKDASETLVCYHNQPN